MVEILKYTTEQLKTSYPVKCDCGWRGLSEDCAGGGAIADTGDYSDPLCPVCIENANKECEACSVECHGKCWVNTCGLGSLEDDDDYEEIESV